MGNELTTSSYSGYPIPWEIILLRLSISWKHANAKRNKPFTGEKGTSMKEKPVGVGFADIEKIPSVNMLSVIIFTKNIGENTSLNMPALMY